MERNFTNENFEEFLQRQSNSLRMRPSEKVWKNIASQLYERRRRLGIIASFFLITAAVFGYHLEHENGLKPKPGVAHSPIHQQSRTATSQTPITFDNSYERSTPAVERKQLSSIATGSYLAFGYHRPAVAAPDGVIPQPGTSGALEAAGFTPTIVDEYVPASRTVVAPGSPATESRQEYPQTIESVFNSYQAPKKHKIGLQLTFAPTISYRKLSENKSYLRSVPQLTVPYNYAALYSVNDIVTSKPNMGFELGLNGKYAITKKLNVTGGIQFNVSRYDLKVFHSYMGIATIALNTGRAIDSVRTLTTYSSTNNGYGSDWLQNFFFQMSAPVGIELKLRGDDRMQFGVATTIQPTYILGDRVYLISTDYKNYAQVPWLTRHWNVNTNLETFVSYSTGHFKWQVGPQVRYQLLSSFINKYPVKENLFDFGLKVGISLNHY